VQERFRARAGERRGQAVDPLAALPAGELPVGERAQVAERVSEARAQLLDRTPAHVIEIDDDGDGDLDAVRALAAVMLERRDGRGDPVVGQVRGDGDHRQPGQARRVLGDVERSPAPDPDDRVVGAGPQGVRQLEGAVKRPALDEMDLRVLERRAHDGDDLLALARPDDDGDVAARGDATVAQERREGGDRAAAHLHRQRRGHHAGEERHLE
jgi:hypothetical protein